MKKNLILLGPVAFVVGQYVPEKYRLPRLLLLATGGVATAVAAWDAYKKSTEESWGS